MIKAMDIKPFDKDPAVEEETVLELSQNIAKEKEK